MGFGLGSVVNGCTIIAEPTNSGIYGNMFELQRSDNSTFFAFVDYSGNTNVEKMNLAVNSFELNNSNPLPVAVVSGGAGSTVNQFSTASTTAHNITSSTTAALIPANPNRQYLGYIIDPAATGAVYIGWGFVPSPTLYSGIVPLGGSDEPVGSIYTGAIYGVTATGTIATLMITEGTP